MDARDEEVGRRVEVLRKRLDLSQAEMSERLRANGLNWSQGTLSKVETGARPVRLVEVPALSMALNVEPLALFPGRPALEEEMSRARILFREARAAFHEAEERFASARGRWEALALLVRLADGDTSRYIVLGCSPLDILRKATSGAGSPSRLDEDAVLAGLGFSQQELGALQAQAQEHPDEPRESILSAFGSVKIPVFESLFGTEDSLENQIRRAYMNLIGQAFEDRFPNVKFEWPENDLTPFRVLGIDDEDED
jgi:transcriptional regulator with XRE-family HTH domain